MTNKSYSEREKNKILNDLNETRLSEQKKDELKKKRTYNKKIYKIASKQCYKFMHMERKYYITVDDCDRLTSKPRMTTLYYKTFDEVKTKKYLIKTEVYSDKFFITEDPIRVYYKAYVLENNK